MKKIVLAISLVLIALGATFYVIENQIEKKVVFRNVYGYIGLTLYETYNLDFTIYRTMNEDLDYLYSSENIYFYNDNIDVLDSSIESIDSTVNIEVLILHTTITLKTVGKEEIKEIRFISDGIEKRLSIGNITIEKIQNINGGIKHGAGTLFDSEGIYHFSISRTNTESIELLSFEFDSEYISSLEGEFPVSFVPGGDESMYLEFSVEYSVDEYDIFIFKPIAVYRKLGSLTNSYFSVLIATKDYVDMNYKEIREYINND